MVNAIKGLRKINEARSDNGLWGLNCLEPLVNHADKRMDEFLIPPNWRVSS